MPLILNRDVGGVVDSIVYKYFIVDKYSPVVITFSPANIVVNENSESPWAFDFLKQRGVNVFSFSCSTEKNWYRSKSLIQFLKKISEDLKEFPERLGYGSSMGGYAVSAFSQILGLDRILLINPISTLNRRIVPFETRFRTFANNLDWEFECFDGADTEALGYVIYDPIYRLDRKHAERYKNLVHLRFPGVGHNMPKHLQDLRVLSTLVLNFIENSTDINDFFKKIRARRELPRYYQWRCSEENKHLTKKRRRVLEQYALQKNIRVDIVSSLQSQKSNLRVKNEEKNMSKYMDGFVANFREANEKLLDNIDDRKLAITVRTIFEQLAKEIEELDAGEKLKIPGLGTIFVKELEKDGNKLRRVFINTRKS